ncbi:MAG: hypothetical protein IT340_23740 [Chloroflexi bacterium]|nr:hypothetical protein [Chloroflexota bacterium]
MISPQLIEIASWRVATELVRRRPADLQIVETHPGGGQYDGLSIMTGDPAHPTHLIDLNRVGSAHVFGDSPARYPDFWEECCATDDLRPLVDRLATAAGLGAGQSVPPSTPRSVSYRCIAALLAQAAFGRVQWTCRSGAVDSAGFVVEPVQRAWFARFDGAAARLVIHDHADLVRQPAYRFWFLLRDNEPVLCLETTGRAWDRHGHEHRLDALYRQGRRLWPVIVAVAGDLLP